MQEICVDLLLPESCQLAGFDFKRTVLELNGRLYPQDLVQAQFEYFRLAKGPVPQFVLDNLPEGLKVQSWQCISITADDDHLAAGLLNPLDIYTEDGIFSELLECLTEQASHWVLVFTSDCDMPQEVLKGNLDTALQRVCESIENSSGFMMYQDEVALGV